MASIPSAAGGVPENAANAAPEQVFFRDSVYKQAKAAGRPVPWDILSAQPALQAVAHLFQGSVIDCGCGTGDNAIWLASLPDVGRVTAFDFSEDAVQEAQARLQAAQREFKVHAQVAIIQADVFQLGSILPTARDSFDVLLDSAVFHCIGDDSAQRRYLAAVTPMVKNGGKVVMLVFSDKNPDPWRGPRRISPEHARALWTEAGWTVEAIQDAKYMDNIHEGGGEAILMVASKTTPGSQ